MTNKLSQDVVGDFVPFISPCCKSNLRWLIRMAFSLAVLWTSKEAFPQIDSQETYLSYLERSRMEVARAYRNATSRELAVNGDSGSKAIAMKRTRTVIGAQTGRLYRPNVNNRLDIYKPKALARNGSGYTPPVGDSRFKVVNTESRQGGVAGYPSSGNKSTPQTEGPDDPSASRSDQPSMFFPENQDKEFFSKNRRYQPRRRSAPLSSVMASSSPPNTHPKAPVSQVANDTLLLPKSARELSSNPKSILSSVKLYSLSELGKKGPRSRETFSTNLPDILATKKQKELRPKDEGPIEGVFPPDQKEKEEQRNAIVKSNRSDSSSTSIDEAIDPEFGVTIKTSGFVKRKETSRRFYELKESQQNERRSPIVSVPNLTGNPFPAVAKKQFPLVVQPATRESVFQASSFTESQGLSRSKLYSLSNIERTKFQTGRSRGKAFSPPVIKDRGQQERTEIVNNRNLSILSAEKTGPSREPGLIKPAKEISTSVLPIANNKNKTQVQEAFRPIAQTAVAGDVLAAGDTQEDVTQWGMSISNRRDQNIARHPASPNKSVSKSSHDGSGHGSTAMALVNRLSRGSGEENLKDLQRQEGTVEKSNVGQQEDYSNNPLFDPHRKGFAIKKISSLDFNSIQSESDGDKAGTPTDYWNPVASKMSRHHYDSPNGEDIRWQQLGATAASVPGRPLYWEEVNLERHGTSIGIFQPALSAGRFFGAVPLLPYKINRQSPDSLVESASPYPAGLPAPWVRETEPLSLRPSATELLSIGAAILIIP
ncbi:MAG: hypothetical protein P8M80_09000 [Pirellulaceae bacterium]|nr:hypothetical protein [Pirellulaceae bacterium]